jgi:small GTP-binding protein
MKNVQYKKLLRDFLSVNKEVEAILLSDEEGFIISGIKRADIDIELVSFLTAIVNPVLERMRNEFAFKQFGTASFDTDEHRLLFITIKENTTLSLVMESMGSIDKISPYAYFLAEKTAQFLTLEEDQEFDFALPSFDYDEKIEGIDRIKYQLYQDRLGTGGDFRFKFIIIGDHEVGKTSIVRRFVDDRFSVDYRATIGLNIIPHDFEAFNNKISLSLWDIGAQQYFKRYRKTYYNGAQAAFIVFDLTNPTSFENVKTWHNELKEFIENKDLPIIIIGNKADLVEEREVTRADGLILAKDLSDLTEFSDLSEASAFVDMSELTDSAEKSSTKIPYLETSAKTGQHILYAFSLISYHFILRCKELEEEQLTKEIIEDINSIIEDVGRLTITFVSEDPTWSPGLQVLSEIKTLGSCTKFRDKKTEKIYQYPSGLVLKNYSFDNVKAMDSDCVFCLFDAREKEHIDPKWNNIINKLIKKLERNKVISIGVRISENGDWSQLIEEFDVSDQAEKKMVTILFFKLGDEHRIEIFEQLGNLLKTIKDLIFAY